MPNSLWVAAAALLCSVATSAQAKWHEARSKHFIIYSEDGEAGLRAYAEKLERVDQAIRYLRKMGDPPLTEAQRLTIFVVNTESDIEKLAGYQGVRGFYVPSAGGSVAYVPRRSGMRMIQGTSDGTGTQKDGMTGEIVFFHEYAHHLQLQDWAAVMPVWVREGFAEFFATAEVDKGGNVTLGKFPSYRSYEVFVASGLSAKDLVASDFDKLNWYESFALYGRSWLLTHYLSFADGRRGQLSKYLAAMEKGTVPLDSATAAFGNLDTLNREVDAYGATRNFIGLTIDSKFLSPGEVKIRALGPGESAMMPARLRAKSKFRRSSGQARAVASQARSAAANFRGDAIVQAHLAEAEYNARNYAAAEAAADRALAANPDNVQALIYKGRAKMKLAKGKAEPAAWKDVRALLMKANKLDTENAEPLAEYFRSYIEAGERPTANAVEAILYAVDLAPQDDELRIDATRQLLADNRLPDAAQMFAAIAYTPHGEKEVRAENAKIMAAIKAGDRTGAITLIDAKIAEANKKG